MKIKDAINILNKSVPNPNKGLPEEIFLFVSKITPLVNVDLLIKDEKGRTLLSWRNDKYAGTGWHIPGGIIRFREKFETRLKKVAENEIGIKDIEFDPVPLALNQLIHYESEERSHFVSILYKCFLPSTFIPENKDLKESDVGYLKWHEACPDNLIKFHDIYKKFF